MREAQRSNRNESDETPNVQTARISDCCDHSPVPTRLQIAIAALALATSGCTSSGDVASPSTTQRPDTSKTTLPFESLSLAGLCEDSIADFADGEPAPSSTEAEALAEFIQEHPTLRGLDLGDGVIMHREQQVGTYNIVDRPEGTVAVESGEWCFPASSGEDGS